MSESRSAEPRTDNFGLPITREGQHHHSLLHRERGTEHPLVGYCPEAQEVKAIEAAAQASAAPETGPWNAGYNHGYADGLRMGRASAAPPDEGLLRRLIEQADWLGLLPEYDDSETGARPDCVRAIRRALADKPQASAAPPDEGLREAAIRAITEVTEDMATFRDVLALRPDLDERLRRALADKEAGR